MLAHALEGDAELIEVDGALPPRPGVQPSGVEPEPLAAGRELVAAMNDPSQRVTAVARVWVRLRLGRAYVTGRGA